VDVRIDATWKDMKARRVDLLSGRKFEIRPDRFNAPTGHGDVGDRRAPRCDHGAAANDQVGRAGTSSL
jgi:hypothetical protein